MDISKEYITMCTEASEIQKLWLTHDTKGDFAVPRKTIDGYNGFWSLKKGIVYIVGNDCEYSLTIEDINDVEGTMAIWLPRQDQLQEMICKMETITEIIEVGSSITKRLAMMFGIWVNKGTCKNLFSWEQYLLAWLMEIKYNKMWDGNKWVKLR